MTTWMHDAVHVEVKTVELLVIGVGSACIDWYCDAVYFCSLLLDAAACDFGVLCRQPSAVFASMLCWVVSVYPFAV